MTSFDQLKNAPAIPDKVRSADISNPFGSIEAFEAVQRIVVPLSKSSMVPQQFQGDIGACLIAYELSQRTRASIFMVMQNVHVIHGRPSWSAKFLIASVNSCGRFEPLKYRMTGEKGKDTWGCIAWTRALGSDEKLEGPEVTIKLAKDENWYQKNGSKWKTMPEIMLRYRAASFWTNQYAPEISVGMMTTEEFRDVYEAEAGPSGEYSVVVSDGKMTSEELHDAYAAIDTETGEVVADADLPEEDTTPEKDSPLADDPKFDFD